MKSKKNNVNFAKIIFYLALIFVILIIGYFFIIYYQILNDKHDGYDSAVNYILSETNVNEITDVTYFQEEDGYFIMSGIDDEAEQVFVYLLDKEPFVKTNVIIVSKNNFIAEDKLLASWQNECTNCELIDMTPAMIKGVPLWEITYIDENNRYVIEYKTKTNGEIYEQLRFTQN